MFNLLDFNIEGNKIVVKFEKYLGTSEAEKRQLTSTMLSFQALLSGMSYEVDYIPSSRRVNETYKYKFEIKNSFILQAIQEKLDRENAPEVVDVEEKEGAEV